MIEANRMAGRQAAQRPVFWGGELIWLAPQYAAFKC